MGFVFWYLGNGAEYGVNPRSVGMYHREHFVGFRQEEISVVTDRLIFNLRGGYLTGIERIDEWGNIVGEYDAVFTGANLIFANASLGEYGWSFGIGPGFMLSKIYNYSDYAVTFNALVLGRFRSGEMMLLLQNLGYGTVLPTPELYLRGLSYNQNFRFGPFLRLFGDRDFDGGFIFGGDLSILSFNVSPSLRNALVGISLQVGPFSFVYDYLYYWIGYTTHRVGINVSWGKHQEMEERLRRHEMQLQEHERRITQQEREIRNLKRRISEMENKAQEYARRLVKEAEDEEDPQEALWKLELAYAFDTTLNVQRRIADLKSRIVARKKRNGIRKVQVFLKNRLYSQALAEVLSLIEEFPDDKEVLALYRRVKRLVESQRNSARITTKAYRKYSENRLQKAQRLLKEGKYVKAASIVSSLPPSAEKIQLMRQLREASDRYVERAKSYMERGDWAKAKYFLEMALKIYPNTEATSLLSYVEGRIRKNAHLHYLKALELYQKGDVVGAFAHIKEAYLLDPKNERYRNIYYRLKNALEDR
ncbi:MAG: hypothetical protein GXO39_03745 [Thermotogae bacterium]|nr:hypothetical protein [Thermotogota bacterium]